MKYLIVNADDLGADVYRNQGIAEAIEAGVVTSVSVLANGPAFEDALARLPAWQSRGISVGIHVNLSEGCPVGKGLHLIPDEHGSFRGKSPAHNMLMQNGNRELESEVEQEIEAQIGLLEGQNIMVSHLDGHQHVHVFPAVIAAAVRAAQRHAIPWFRIPEEEFSPPLAEGDEGEGEISLKNKPICHPRAVPPPSRGRPLPNVSIDPTTRRPYRHKVQPTISLFREAARFSRLAAAARHFLTGSRIRTTDHFRGLYLKGRMTLPLLEELLNDLPAGLTELMAHPGRFPARALSSPFSSFSNADRERELNVLLNPLFLDMLKAKGVMLTPYPEAGL